MKKFYQLAILFTCFVCYEVSAQVAGSLDTTFNGTGIFKHDFGNTDNLTDVKIQPADQKIVVAGTSFNSVFSGKLLVARILPGGGFDTGFNGTGSLIIPDYNESYAYESAIRDDGKILIGGAAADSAFQFSMLVIRLNSDGTIDSTFGTNGMVTPEISTGDDFAYAMVEQPDHKIILAGTALDSNFYNAPVVVRLNENGTRDSTFGTNGAAYIVAPDYIDNELTSVALQLDGKIVVSGHFDNNLTGGGQFDFDILVARYNPDGSADSTFGVNGFVKTGMPAGLIDDAFGLAITPDGNILVSGFTSQVNFSYDAILLKYDSTGTLDPTFGTGGIVVFDYGAMDVAFDIDLQTDDKILLAGIAGVFVPDDNNFWLARYNSNGTPDLTFNTTGYTVTHISSEYDEAESMSLQADGKIVLAGKSNNGSDHDIAVARYLNDVSSGVQEINSTHTVIVYPNPASIEQPITLLFESTNKGNSILELYDLQGSLVISSKLEGVVPGFNSRQFLLPSSLGSGMYFIKIKNKNEREFTGKLLIR